MSLFESLLVLLALAIVLLRVSRRIAVPYPTMLAVAGVIVAALPSAPVLAIEPDLALALFIAPALLDAAFDLPPRVVRREWIAVVALAVVAVLLTAAAVAAVAIAWTGMPVVSAIALGAIVAPPDAAAAAAMLARFELPRRTVAVLQSESLLNDAVALLLFSAAVGAAGHDAAPGALVLQLALAAPGGVLFGYVAARVFVVAERSLSGTLAGTLAQFVATFGVWVIAEHLRLSAVLAVVTYAMTIARIVPERTSARDRVHSYAVWGVVVFVLDVLAFLLIGMQARRIIAHLHPHRLGPALAFAGVVTLVVIVVRIAWVMLFRRLRRGDALTVRQSVVVAWCGMRGLVTLATALALPASFPERDIVVLSAFGVVFGTLVVQGFTLGPLIRRLGFTEDPSFAEELATARLAVIDAALAYLGERDDRAARRLREAYGEARDAAERGETPVEASEIEALRRELLPAKRARLAELRHDGAIGDDVFHFVERELDMIELGATKAEEAELAER